MLRCSNPICRADLETPTIGTTKAGDVVELLHGERKYEDVRQLCPRCATYMISLESKVADIPSLHVAFGWGP